MTESRAILVKLALRLSCSRAHADIVFNGRLNESDFSSYRALEVDRAVFGGALAPNDVQARLERVLDPAGSGKRVMQATHIPGDMPTNGGYRSEVSAFKDPIGSERWYSWGYYLPETFKTIKNDIAIAQIHDTPDLDESNMRNPTLAVLIQDDRLKLINTFDYDRITPPSERGR